MLIKKLLLALAAVSFLVAPASAADLLSGHTETRRQS